jgi:hypothetical protein
LDEYFMVGNGGGAMPRSFISVFLSGESVGILFFTFPCLMFVWDFGFSHNRPDEKVRVAARANHVFVFNSRRDQKHSHDHG